MSKLPRDFQVFVIAVIMTAAVTFYILAPTFLMQWWELLLFTLLIGLAAMSPIPDPRGGYITATGTLFYVLMSVHGPAASLAVAGTAYGVGAAVSRGWFPWRTAFNGAQMGLSVALASTAFRLLGGSASADWESFFFPFVAASLVHQASNNFFVAFYFSRLRGTPLLSTWITDVRDFLWSNLLTLPTAALLTILYVSIHPLSLLIYLVSLPLQRRALQLYLQQRRLHTQAIDALTVAIDADFPQGQGHSRRVADTAVAIARQLGLSDASVEAIELGALMHDVGLIGLDDLLKEGRAAPGEGVGFEAHVRIGAEIVRELQRKEIADIVLYHHERFDGKGYPNGLANGGIPLSARIVALAEAFESMRAGGFPYNEAGLPFSDAVKAIERESGEAFDPAVVAAFLEAVTEGTIAPTHSAGSEAK
jgi:putative nucleotidyltransferase with HDIG domain